MSEVIDKINAAIEQGVETHDNKLSPQNWFSEDEKNPHFVPYNCAMDYFRVFPHVVTEYNGTMHQFIGKYYLKNAEGTIRTNIETAGTGIIKPRDINDAVTSLSNITRIIDPDKIDLPMERIMPLPAHTIPIEGGLLNILTKAMTPHSAEYYYTECLPRRYVQGATPDVFLAFLDSLFLGDPDAPLKKTQIFEIIAWTLMSNYDIQGAVILYGQGGEGKSIIHSVIGDLLLHVTSLTLSELENDKFKRAELYGSWANLISESSTEIITSEWFKRLTDGTIITVDRKNGHPFKMVSRAKMLLDVNELPNKENELRAFYRRVITIIDFPNWLESILTPTQISEFVNKMKDPVELDRIFSYVVDNYYGPLVSRMKFTGQLSLSEAEQKWEERSNPAKSYLKMKNENGDILTDVDSVRALLQGNANSEKRYITRENSGEEYLTMIKNDVLVDAVKWATAKGFPAKTIHSGTLGAALVSLGFPNQTVSKKVSRGSILKAWRDIFLNIFDESVTDQVTDQRNPPLPPEAQSRIDEMQSGNGSSLLPLHARAHAHMRENKGASVTELKNPLETTEEKQVTGTFSDPLPDPLPQDQENDKNAQESAIQNENSTFSMDQVLAFIKEIKSKHPSWSKHEIVKVVRDQYAGIALGPIYDLIKQLQGEGESDKKPLEPQVQEPKEQGKTDIQMVNSLWRTNPKKALFELVETEAPKAEYHSLKPKAIHALISMRGISLSTVYDLCEQLHGEGAFLKNTAGGYSVNREFLNGGDYP